MKQITYVGPDEYNSYDEGEAFQLAHGESRDVSDATADRLAEERPSDFSIDGSDPAPPPAQDEVDEDEVDAPEDEPEVAPKRRRGKAAAEDVDE